MPHPAKKTLTEFKQIIGRGTRINEDYNKLFFTIMDVKRAPPSSLSSPPPELSFLLPWPLPTLKSPST
jgi:hypothetical protein